MKKYVVRSLVLALALAGLTQIATADVVKSEKAKSYSAWNCPAELDGDVDKIEEAITDYLKEDNVGAAAQLASNCATFGSGIDVMLLAPINDVLMEKV